jgi:hypothetical protein
LVKLVDRKEIEAADWSLTPGRYVGVAPPEEDEDFDFEQTMRDIHTELADLNKEAAELAAKIQRNFEALVRSPRMCKHILSEACRRAKCRPCKPISTSSV